MLVISALLGTTRESPVGSEPDESPVCESAVRITMRSLMETGLPVITHVHFPLPSSVSRMACSTSLRS